MISLKEHNLEKHFGSSFKDPMGKQRGNDLLLHKFDASCIRKGLINIDFDLEDENDSNYSSVAQGLALRAMAKETSNTRIASKNKKKTQVNLTPMSKITSDSIVTVYQKKEKELKEDFYCSQKSKSTNEHENESDKRKQIDQIQGEKKKAPNPKRCRGKRQKKPFLLEEDQLFVLTEAQNKELSQIKQLKKTNDNVSQGEISQQSHVELSINHLALNTQNLIFFDDEIEEENDQIQIPTTRLTTVFTQSEEDQGQVNLLQNLKPNSKEQIDNLDYFNAQNLSYFKKCMKKQLKKDKTLKATLTRDKDGFNSIWPEFKFYFQYNNLLMAAKQTSRTTPTYIFSTSNLDFSQTEEFYLGKAKESYRGDIINVYGEGLNPENAKSNNLIPRQLLATIVYEQTENFMPRSFKIYIKKPEFNYYCNFNQVRMYREEVPLNVLYQYLENKSKIMVYENRKPVYSPEKKTYYLDFNSPNVISSIKNFILYDRETDQNIMVFAKVTQSNFILEINNPLSPMIGFALALSTFSTRLFTK